MRTIICPGTFDPITNGHIDVIKRARRLGDRLIVLVLQNQAKKTVLPLDERRALVSLACRHFEGVQVQAHDGLLIDAAKANNATAVVRGVRSEIDYAYENMMAQANRALAPDLETVFLPADDAFAFMSSSIVRSVAWFGGDISGFVPVETIEIIKKRYAKPIVEDTYE